jgi:CubicO group peptidase (beta-lactamase class C family)
MSSSPRLHDRLAWSIRVVAALVLLVTSASGCSADLAPEPPPTQAIAEDVDLAVEALNPNQRLRAILVLEHGELVHERYVDSGPDDYWDIASVTTSFIGTLVGIAIDLELITGIEATLSELLPRWESHLTAETGAIPLSAVLTHTANFPAEDDQGEADLWSTNDPIGAILEHRAARGPGDGGFRFSNAGSHVLAAVVAEASGMSILDFARQHLFDPLGIVTQPALEPTSPLAEETLDADMRAYFEADFAWFIDGTGVHLGSGYLKLRPSDLARLGQLYLDRGVWEGDQLVSEEWITGATAPQVSAGTGLVRQYGFQWWVNDDNGYFCAIGAGGTVVLVHPARGVVVVVASARDESQARRDMRVGDALYTAEMILEEFRSTE